MEEKSVLITGSSNGLGAALALTYAQNGYGVIIHGRDEKRLAQIEVDLGGEGYECDVIKGDLTSGRTLTELTEIAKRRNLDVLINNAGIYPTRPFLRMTEKEIIRIIAVNLVVPIMLTKMIFPIFKKRMSGLIININSVAGKVAGPLEPVYCASKHGLRGFAKSIRREASKHNIRVMDVFLGAMRTDMTKGRADFGKFINVYEAAEMIFDAAKTYNTADLREVIIGRRNY